MLDPFQEQITIIQIFRQINHRDNKEAEKGGAYGGTESCLKDGDLSLIVISVAHGYLVGLHNMFECMGSELELCGVCEENSEQHTGKVG